MLDTNPKGFALIFMLFGVYLLVGAITAVRMAEWPIFMPPQIDFFALIFSLLGKKAGAYLGAVLLTAVGCLCILLGVAVLKKPA